MLRNKLKNGEDVVELDSRTFSFPKCTKCGKHHRGGEKACWHKKENRDKVPWNKDKAEE